jgi:hypothetical protein
MKTSMGTAWTLRRFMRDLVDNMGVGRHRPFHIARSSEIALRTPKRRYRG